MNSGILQFSLGLGAGGFLGPLGVAGAKLKGFIGGLVSVGAMYEGVMSQIERGAALEHLHKRTDTSIGDLYKLGRGFQAVGLEADAVGPILFKTQKALGGVNEYGVDTKSVFHRMGLSIDALKKMNAPAQLQAIAGALAKLNTTAAASAAGQLFGREAAGQVVQLARSNAEFSEAIAKGQRYAALWEKLAPLADKFERSLKYVGMEIDAIWTEAATQLLPIIQSIINVVSKIDFSRVARTVGETILTIAEIFKEGAIGDVLAQGFIAGAEKASNFITGLFGSGEYWKGIWDVMKGEFLVALGTMMTVSEAWIAANAATIEKVLHPSKSWKDLYQNNMAGMEKGLGKYSAANMTYSGAQSIAGGVKEQAGALADAFKNSGGPEQDKFMSMIAGLRGRAKNLAGQTGEAPDKNKPGDALEATGQHYKPEANAFEKMGFVMGGANPILELNRRMATGIDRTVSALNKISGQLAGGGDANHSLVNLI